MTLDPFGKPLTSIEAKDLSVFKDISEGWFVDYKRKTIGIKETAKQLCSFANQFGGYLIFGIIESNDSRKCAEQFTGLPSRDIEQLSIEIREAASAHSSPDIYYEEKIICGPCVEIGLPAEMNILIVYVPQSLYPPHIHSCGKVYVRHGDQSKPKEVADRYTFDRLVERCEANKLNLLNIITEKPDLPERQRTAPFLYVYLAPGPTASHSEKNITFNEFNQLVRGGDTLIGEHMPMQVVHSFGGGFIAKQTMGNDPSLVVGGVKYWHNRTIRFDMPCSYGTLASLFSKSPGSNYKHALSFADEYHKQGFTDVPICDYSQVLLTLRSLCNLYLCILHGLGEEFDIYSTFEIVNTHWSIPFIDSASYVDRCKENGIFFIQDKNIRYREKPFYDNMMRHKAHVVFGTDAAPAQHYSLSEPIGFMIQHFLGIVNEVADYSPTESACSHLLK